MEPKKGKITMIMIQRIKLDPWASFFIRSIMAMMGREIIATMARIMMIYQKPMKARRGMNMCFYLMLSCVFFG
jgi:hypothetical protein